VPLKLTPKQHPTANGKISKHSTAYPTTKNQPKKSNNINFFPKKQKILQTPEKLLLRTNRPMVQPTFPTQKIAMVQGVDSEFGLGAMGAPGPAAAGKVGGKRITSWMGRGRLLDVV